VGKEDGGDGHADTVKSHGEEASCAIASEEVDWRRRRLCAQLVPMVIPTGRDKMHT
jgi:hypothetical protein